MTGRRVNPRLRDGPQAALIEELFAAWLAANPPKPVDTPKRLDSIRGMMGHRQGIGGFGATTPSSGAASGSGSPSATAPASADSVAREARHEETRSGDDEEGSSHGDDQADEGDYQDHGDDQHDGDFDDGSGDFDDDGDFGGADDEV